MIKQNQGSEEQVSRLLTKQNWKSENEKTSNRKSINECGTLTAIAFENHKIDHDFIVSPN